MSGGNKGRAINEKLRTVRCGWVGLCKRRRFEAGRLSNDVGDASAAELVNKSREGGEASAAERVNEPSEGGEASAVDRVNE